MDFSIDSVISVIPWSFKYGSFTVLSVNKSVLLWVGLAVFTIANG